MSSPLLQRYIIRQRQANGKASNTTLTTRLPGTSLMDFFWLQLMTTSSITSARLTLSTFNVQADTKLLATLLTFNFKISQPEILCMACNFVCQSYNIFWWCLPHSIEWTFLNLIWSPQNEPSVESAESVNISFQCHYEPGQGTEGKFEDIRRLEVGRLRIRHWMFW